MQHQSPGRNFAAHSLSGTWRPTLNRSSVPDTQDRWASAHAAQEEAWTQYDGLGPVNPVRDLSRDWRSKSGGSQQSPSSSHGPQRGRNADIRSPFGKGGNKGRGGGGYRETSRDGRSPPSKRGRQAQSARGPLSLKTEIVDDIWLTKNFEQLQPDDYNSAPETLFTNPKGFLWDFKGITPKSSFASHKGGIYRCTVFATLPDRSKIEACGDAKNKLHQNGMLHEIINNTESAGAHDKELLNDEADAKMDIYDYCARFDAVPTVSVRETRRPGTRKGLYEVTVGFPEQNILATARASELKHAEIVACVEFKRQAEEFHSKKGGSTIIVKDISSINSRNARKFFEFLKMFDKHARYDVDLRQTTGRRGTGGAFRGQMILNEEPIGEPVEFVGKKHAEAAAYLTGAIGLKEKRPELFPKFIEALKIGNGELLRPLLPSWINIDRDCISTMADTLFAVKRIGLPPTQDEEDRMEREEKERNSWRSGPRRALDPAFLGVKSKKLLESYQEYLNDPRLETLKSKREELPMNQYRAKVLDLVNNNSVSIIVGATGSGKTTQVPQILLEEAIKNGTGASCNIICTQPRRIAATSVAARVAVERNEPLQKSIGYQVRFDAKLPIAGGSVTYCTTGILLQQLRNSADEALDGITHLVIDEVHERDILIDFLLIILKRVMQDRMERGLPEVKIVLMSATMDTELFASYFQYKRADGQLVPCPNLSVPGRTFPVKEVYLQEIRDILRNSYPPNRLTMLREDDTRMYLDVEQSVSRDVSRVPSRVPSRATSTRGEMEEDDTADATINWKQEIKLGSDGQAVVSNEKEDALVPIGLIALTVAHITKISDDGAILVFLPGLEELQAVDEALRTQRPLGVDFRDESKFKLSMLHSSIPNQNEVFEDVPEGCRKVILSTNIAETSVTIPDVKYVVDSGKLREKQYEQARRITQLVCTWISKSNSKQRAGRAGRVQNGNYYALFSKSRYDSLRGTGLPEMLRSDLQEICLDIKAQGFKDSVAQFLSEAIEPPSRHSIEASLTQLRLLGALTETEGLTPLGRVLATMPVEPALGKMILLAVIFRCLDPIMILGSSSGVRDIFVAPPERRAEANRTRNSFVRDTGSDHMAIVNAFREWRTIRDRDGVHAAHRFAEDNFLHRGALRTLDATTLQIEELLAKAGIIPYVRRNERNRSEIGHPSSNEYSDHVPLIKALTLAGMYPNVAVATGGKGLRTPNENFSMIHPTSVHYAKGDSSMPFGTLVIFTTRAKSNDGGTLLLRTVTEARPLMPILFGGKLESNHTTLEIDGWLPFQVPPAAVKTTKDFRLCLDRLLGHAFRGLSKRNSQKNSFLADDKAREAFAEGLVELLKIDHQQAVRRAVSTDRERGSTFGHDRNQPWDTSRQGFGGNRNQSRERGSNAGGFVRDQSFDRGNSYERFGSQNSMRRDRSFDRSNFGQGPAPNRGARATGSNSGSSSFQQGTDFGAQSGFRRELSAGGGRGDWGFNSGGSRRY
ncbi:P-loop containing nucleoside triphosphate hydrolase protein [Choiromyces venosus 120613-1]|uniref:P-loop containing nucleoside triphosphate hydrolase protein n=1 Tax=Choiromyces venosus 120613-1 TaxID=1336337 RepID=A0A3N4JHI8_9PEZI|nr:P-loop containing nucleoside triphosphate hydrolase protein [Choiromyces venosus 120613-1]